jgi:hypothetical protein
MNEEFGIYEFHQMYRCSTPTIEMLFCILNKFAHLKRITYKSTVMPAYFCRLISNEKNAQLTDLIENTVAKKRSINDKILNLPCMIVTVCFTKNLFPSELSLLFRWRRNIILQNWSDFMWDSIFSRYRIC